VRTLLLDNYDSFTFNLFQVLAEVNGEDPVVVRNDGATWAEVASWHVDNVVISPGPGRPEREADFGICREAIDAARVPVLGVCLGHQGLAWRSGASVVHAPEVMHGRLSAVYHDGSPLFAGIPQGFQAVRYHSLCVRGPVPPPLEPIAWTEDGVVMAVAHRERPLWGVQFHPESICTEYGRRVAENFRDLTPRRRRRPRTATRCVVPRGRREEQPDTSSSAQSSWTASRRRSAPAARSSCSRTPTTSSTRCCSRRRRSCARSRSAPALRPRRSTACGSSSMLTHSAALVCGEQRLDEDELAERAGRVARGLDERGIGPGDPSRCCSRTARTSWSRSWP
jgi:anthranilate synthase/aminodeoxychorismate synthase-like glutamine amidotransferase